MRFLLTTGGTGGHIFPALALAEELCEKKGTVLFAGGNLSKNPYFKDAAFPFKDVACSPHLIRGLGNHWKGILEAARVIRDFNPDAVIGFGSYYTLPVLIAAKWLGKPLLLHEANSIPGRVNRLFAPFADKTWTYFPKARLHLFGKVEECKMPLRSHFRKGIVSKEEARKFFNLNPDQLTLLIFGGSQGAKVINALFSETAVLELKKILPPFQIIHFTGLNQTISYEGIPHFVKPFEKRIDLAWAAADLSITRAGASSIAEQFEYGVPGLVIPFERAKDKHQEHNAAFLQAAGIGVSLLESEVESSFVEKLAALYNNREHAQERWNQYKKCHSLRSLSEEILNWLEEKKA